MHGTGARRPSAELCHDHGNRRCVECSKRIQLDNQIPRQNDRIDLLRRDIGYRRRNILVGADRWKHDCETKLGCAGLDPVHADGPIGMEQLKWNIPNAELMSIAHTYYHAGRPRRYRSPTTVTVSAISYQLSVLIADS
jgi:hypothetical protein